MFECSSNGNTIKATFVVVRILITTARLYLSWITEKFEVIIRVRIFFCAEWVGLQSRRFVFVL